MKVWGEVEVLHVLACEAVEVQHVPMQKAVEVQHVPVQKAVERQGLSAEVMLGSVWMKVGLVVVAVLVWQETI